MAKQIDAKDLLTAFDLPPAQAIKFLKKKGYAITFDWKEMDAAAHELGFTIAGVTDLTVLADVKELLEQTLAQGTTWKSFSKELPLLLAERGWGGPRRVKNAETGEEKIIDLTDPHRMRTIFMTNTLSALNAGRSAQQLAAKKTRPYYILEAVNDGRRSEICDAINGKVFRQDDAGAPYPPLHHRCRTTARTLSQKQINARELDVTSSDDLTGWEPAKGFEGRPTLKWDPDLSKLPPELVKEYRKRQTSRKST